MEERVFSFLEPLKKNDNDSYYQSDNHLKHFHDKILFPLQESKGANPYSIRKPVGVLIYGAPGCGKSFLAIKFASMLNRPYIIINRYDILTKMNSEYCYEINKLFNKASEISATIIIEDIETIFPSRDRLNNHSTLLDVANVLNLIKSCPEKNVIVIATTSRPQDVDPQIGYSGYLDELFYTPFPDFEMRCDIIRSSLNGRPKEPIDIKRLAKECEGYSIDNIIDVINDASIDCSLRSCPLSTESISKVISNKGLVMDPSIRKKYEEIHLRLEKNKTPSKGIGFV